ncbi:MAG: thiamine-phosphate kinase [Candidatus Sedimenticola sp. (ex Thyasira tokunagai)]
MPLSSPMALSEFELIRSYFSHTGSRRNDVLLGVGDDCALLQPPSGMQLAVSIDTLVEGVHFFPNTDPESLGHKTLAVNLSDLAAMGAQPAWVTLALTLPRSDPSWLEGFSRGFADLAERYGVQLIGGDTTSGPLNISVQVHGFVEPAKALHRDAAQPGDLIYVTGTLGDAGLALLQAQGRYALNAAVEELKLHLEKPEPRINVGIAVAGIAAAGIDISDGLLSDLGHICRASGVGATLQLTQIPLSAAVAAYIEESGDWTVPLAAGDDYELCLTVPDHRREVFESLASDMDVELTLIGRVEEGSGVRIVDGSGEVVSIRRQGFEHFYD